MFKRSILLITIVVATTALYGCASDFYVPIVKINADRQAYLQRYFSTAMLDRDVRNKIISSDSSVKAFHHIHVVDEVKTYDLGGKHAATLEQRITFEGLDHGLVASVTRTLSNGIDAFDVYALSYRNLLPLRSQFVSGRFAHPLPVENISAIKRFVSFPGKSRIDDAVITGFDGIFAALPELDVQCHAAGSIALSSLNEALRGDGQIYDCRYSKGTGVGTTERKFVYVQQYGIFIRTEKKTSSGTFVDKIVSFRVS